MFMQGSVLEIIVINAVVILISRDIGYMKTIMTLKSFPNYRSFVRGIHGYQGFPSPRVVMQSFAFIYVVSVVKLLNKQSIAGHLRCHDTPVTSR